MGLRWFIILLLSVALVGTPAVRPVAAMTMAMPAGVSSQLPCRPHGHAAPGTAAPASCAKSLACIALDGVQPAAIRLAGSARAARTLFPWHASARHGADMAPETGPPKRPA